jgi:hypothetical protein
MLLSLGGIAVAHQETSLKVAGNKLVGLPEQYSPSSFDFEKNQLLIGGKALKLPSFLAGILNRKRTINDEGQVLFQAGVIWRLEVAASWYHDKSEQGSLSDYLLLEFYPQNKDYHFKVFVNLEKPEVVGSKIVLTTFSKDDGDAWMDSKDPQLESLFSTQMELVIDDSREDVTDRLENQRPSKDQEK